jgi:hypothetical protein
MLSIPSDVRARCMVFLGLTFLLQVGCVGSKEGQLAGAPCDIPPGKNAMQAEQNAVRKSHMIFGEVLRVDGTTYVLKDADGKEVSVKTDETTEKPPVNEGDRITANVDNLNHALWIRSNRGTDRRTEHASADCTP